MAKENILSEDLTKFLASKNLEKVRAFKTGVYLCKYKNGRRVVVKKARGKEAQVYLLLRNKLANLYNKKMRLLKLPRPIYVDTKTGWIILPYYEGRKYNQIWEEENKGGALMGLELSRELAHVLCEFTKVETKAVVNFCKKHQIEKFKFDFEDWYKLFNQNIEKFKQAGLLSDYEIIKAKGILKSDFQNSRMIFSNGDFYPRNFIRTKDKLIALDWQTWDKNYRVCLIDYWENVLAFGYIHMWANNPWQAEYLKEIQKYFKLEKDNFQKALLIKSFEQALFWFHKPDLQEDQLFIFRNALDKEYIEYLINYSSPGFWAKLIRPLRSYWV